jgi:hypothetical protein
MRRIALFVIPFATACYTYAPIEVASVPNGTSVRARVIPAAAARIAPLVGSADARMVSGRLIENRPEGMIVEVPTIVPADIGTSIQILHQRVLIARTDLLELETRHLDPLRTGLLAGGAAIIVGGAAFRALKSNANSGRISPGGSTEIRILFLRISQ